MRSRTFARNAMALAAGIAACLPVAAKDKTPSAKNKPSEVGAVDASGTYRLSAEELAYDCKRLAGRMQVRLLEVRSYDPSKNGSALARTMQSATQPVVGMMLGNASGYSADPDKRHADDIAMLKAYNAQLAAKKCRTYDLEAELGGGKKSGLPSVKAPATK